MNQKQTLWGTVLFTLSLFSIMSLFITIALQINTINKIDRKEEILTAIAENQQEIKNTTEKVIITGTISLIDSEETSSNSTISVEKIDTFVEQEDIVVEEKIVIHTEEPKERKVGDEVVLPDIPTNTYRCEPYLVYDEENEIWVDAFIAGSHQNKLQQVCHTDESTGIRYYIDENGKKWYCAALAGAFGIEIGAEYEFTLANGAVIPVIQADYKHSIINPRYDDYGDADINYDGEDCICVIEFVVDMRVIPDKVAKAGTMSALEQYGGLFGHGGNITNVVYYGRDMSFLNKGGNT